MPAEILLTETCWILGDILCALYYLLPIIIISASVGNMVLISVDRYVAIVDPLHYPTKVTNRIVTICICLCWICSVFYGIILLYDNLKQPGRYNSCYGECVVNITGAVDLVLTFIIPISVIVVLYMRVFVVAVSQARAMRSSITAVSIQLSVKVTVKKSEIKAARTLGIVIVVFLMCYSPYYCVSLTGQGIMIGTATEVFMSYLMYFNSCLNPVIYAFFYPWFKKTIRLILTLKILQPDTCDANIL
ncbi:trace amine-associated receptor 8b-like [Scomber scombrus]|uniref:Trace amine-associated receptor 8b-like n=2 Tax=Scomber scombrus TaxID=13677 RepID=A0AAV1P721_SCOSC